jgi:hypothetical protein
MGFSFGMKMGFVAKVYFSLRSLMLKKTIILQASK